jgi:hypothetical protein
MRRRDASADARGAALNGENAATRWFGQNFVQLHPLLQALHHDGGRLRGSVQISTGRGVAGLIGRRLAHRLGIPLDRMQRGFEVQIRHNDDAMTWERRFDNGRVLTSTFRPVGQYPDGYWLEDTGAVQLKLTVDIVDGGWRWRLLGASLHGFMLPLFLFPRTDAFKRIDGDGHYRFGVAFALFPFGTLLRYEGVLRAETLTPAA